MPPLLIKNYQDIYNYGLQLAAVGEAISYISPQNPRADSMLMFSRVLQCITKSNTVCQCTISNPNPKATKSQHAHAVKPKFVDRSKVGTLNSLDFEAGS
jgi:hypothetical protein